MDHIYSCTLLAPSLSAHHLSNFKRRVEDERKKLVTVVDFSIYITMFPR